MTAEPARLYAALAERLPDAITLRHALHADPRPSGNEHDTAERLMAALGVADAPDVCGGRIVRIGPAAGPAVALRTELDALPITETSGLPWASTNGAAHLCGHDVHMAALVAVLRALRDAGPPVPVVAIFQPREESTPCGAQDMVASTALTDHDIRAVVGVHLQPRIRGGHFSVEPGPVNASADEFFVTINGAAGHGAYPHTTRDPIVAAAALVTALQTLVSRRIDPIRPAVVTVGHISGGESCNAIPESAALRGTIRAFHAEDRELLGGALAGMCRAVASAHGCDAEVRLELGEPVLHNDPALAAAVSAELGSVGFARAEPFRSCGADDFSFYTTRYPAAMVFLGVGDGGRDAPGLHHPAFVPDDDAVGEVARAMLTGYLAGCARIRAMDRLEPERADRV